MDNFDFTILRELRKRKGFSQAQLSESCNITVQTISALEKGRYTPSLSTITSIAKALEVDFSELLSCACLSEPKIVACSNLEFTGSEHNHCKVFDFNTMFVLKSDYIPGEEYCNQLFPLYDLYVTSGCGKYLEVKIDGVKYGVDKSTVIYHDGMSCRVAKIDKPCQTIVIAIPRSRIFSSIFENSVEKVIELAQEIRPSEKPLNGLDFSVLKLIRAARKMSIEALAEKSGVSEQAISDIEQNKRAPILSTVASIARALKISISDFMDFTWRREPKVYDFAKLEERRETVSGQVTAGRIMLKNIVLDYARNDDGKAVTIEAPADPFKEIVVIPLKGQIETIIDGRTYIYGPGHALQYHCNKPRYFKCSAGFEMIVIRRLKNDYYSALRTEMN